MAEKISFDSIPNIFNVEIANNIAIFNFGDDLFHAISDISTNSKILSDFQTINNTASY